MANPKYYLTASARIEMFSIWDYIAIDNADAADRFLDNAHLTFRELAGMPKLGREHQCSSPRLDRLRSFHIIGFEQYRVFYLPMDEGVRIYHVLHSARNLEDF